MPNPHSKYLKFTQLLDCTMCLNQFKYIAGIYRTKESSIANQWHLNVGNLLEIRFRNPTTLASTLTVVRSWHLDKEALTSYLLKFYSEARFKPHRRAGYPWFHIWTREWVIRKG
jgi:hypothetical protein